MASRYMGEMLMAIGKDLPASVRANRLLAQQEEERKRRQRIEDEQLGRESTEFDQEQEALQRKLSDESEARSQLETFNSDVSETDQFSRELAAEKERDAGRTGKYTGRKLGESTAGLPLTLGTTTAGRNLGTVNSDNTFSAPSKFELGQSTGLDRAAQILPQAKGAWETVSAEEKAKRDAADKLALASENAKNRDALAEENWLSKEDLARQQRDFIASQNDLNRGLRRELSPANPVDAKGKAAELKSGIVAAVDEIENDPGFSTGLNPARLLQALPGTPEYAFKKKVENLKGMLSLDQRALLKGQGQISDFEGKILQSAASILDSGLKDTDFRRELNRIRTALSKKPPPPAQGEQKKLTGQPSGGSDFDDLWGD